ncbi:hypothetical protein AWZ03_006032 [Drosophila navojoa]|uniref:Uncharacterized protein n=1 Tax=Drosophila navojoa TaxID=7232 RepID=A0A484BFQ4_DRONA|nr:uncharacterized protein LOC108651161 [Drosophila navojoa]TDG47593.1 hypothetical protein AWZ03_006032 [Drosophila navojoa]
MSNLQDVPLAAPETMPTAEHDTAGTKSNSLKRFFKLGRKSITPSDFSEDQIDLEDEAKDPGKPGSISRFLTRLKGTTKSTVQFTEPDEPASSTVSPAVEEATDKPVPNAKPTIKTSISGYWKQLFHRQKAANRQEEKPAIEMENVPESPQISQEQQSDPVQAEEEPTIPAAEPLPETTDITEPEKTSDIHLNCIPEILEEVQMLAISDVVLNASNEETES